MSPGGHSPELGAIIEPSDRGWRGPAVRSFALTEVGPGAQQGVAEDLTAHTPGLTPGLALLKPCPPVLSERPTLSGHDQQSRFDCRSAPDTSFLCGPAQCPRTCNSPAAWTVGSLPTCAWAMPSWRPLHPERPGGWAVQVPVCWDAPSDCRGGGSGWPPPLGSQRNGCEGSHLETRQGAK